MNESKNVHIDVRIEVGEIHYESLVVFIFLIVMENVVKVFCGNLLFRSTIKSIVVFSNI